MPEIQIRPVVATDLPRLMGMDHSVGSEFVWQLELRRDSGQVVATFREARIPRPLTLIYPRNPYSLADEINDRALTLVALTAAGDPIAYLSVAERPVTIPWVNDLVVTPEWRRRGVAGALLTAVHEWGVGAGYRRLFIEMQAKNQAGIRLAQKHGYEFCGYNDHYYATQDVALFFARALK